MTIELFYIFVSIAVSTIIGVLAGLRLGRRRGLDQVVHVDSELGQAGGLTVTAIMKLSTSLPVEVMKMAFDNIAGHKFRSATIRNRGGHHHCRGSRFDPHRDASGIVSIVEEYGTSNIYVFHLSMGGGGTIATSGIGSR
jgi:hypothetical protein